MMPSLHTLHHAYLLITLLSIMQSTNCVSSCCVLSAQTILTNAPRSQVNLTHGYWIAPSKAKRKLRVDAYWFKVMPGSALQRNCKCSEVELIPDEEYWAELAATRRRI